MEAYGKFILFSVSFILVKYCQIKSHDGYLIYISYIQQFYFSNLWLYESDILTPKILNFTSRVLLLFQMSRLNI